jgi:hypothetical protein
MGWSLGSFYKPHGKIEKEVRNVTKLLTIFYIFLPAAAPTHLAQDIQAVSG